MQYFHTRTEWDNTGAMTLQLHVRDIWFLATSSGTARRSYRIFNEVYPLVDLHLCVSLTVLNQVVQTIGVTVLLTHTASQGLTGKGILCECDTPRLR